MTDTLSDIDLRNAFPTPPRRSALTTPREGPWELRTEAQVSFFVDTSNEKDRAGKWVSFPYHSIPFCLFDPERDFLEVYGPIGMLQIHGTKAKAFWEGLRANRVTLLKSDGEGIAPVHLHVPKREAKGA